MLEENRNVSTLNNSSWVDVSSTTVLLVDDERDVTELIEDVLRKEGFKYIIKANNGLDAIELSKSHKPDAIVLDIMLPDIDGIEVCRRIREVSFCPILFLSSKNDSIDKILGLSSGGDDYITKPFSPKEVAFRIKAQLRRQRYSQASVKDSTINKTFQTGSIIIDYDSVLVYKNGIKVEITSREFHMLVFLSENVNKIISKERLYEKVWGEYSGICDNTIMVHIRHLREKLEDNPSEPKIIVTVKGLGYKLVKN